MLAAIDGCVRFFDFPSGQVRQTWNGGSWFLRRSPDDKRISMSPELLAVGAFGCAVPAAIPKEVSPIWGPVARGPAGAQPATGRQRPRGPRHPPVEAGRHGDRDSPRQRPARQSRTCRQPRRHVTGLIQERRPQLSAGGGPRASPGPSTTAEKVVWRPDGKQFAAICAAGNRVQRYASGTPTARRSKCRRSPVPI